MSKQGITERKWVEEPLAHYKRELSVFRLFGNVVVKSLDLHETLANILSAAFEVLQADGVGVYLLEPDGETMVLSVHHGFSEDFVQGVRRIRRGEGASGLAVEAGRPVVVDVSEYPTRRLSPYLVQEGLRTIVSTPLVVGTTFLGALDLAWRTPGFFPPEELDLLADVGRMIGQAVRNAKLYENLQREFTGRKLAEEEQRKLERQLQTAQKMESVGTLAGGIAHDFNNALTGILGYGELLRMRLADNPKALADLDEISRAAERAATLTRQLLTFARRQVIEPVNLDLRDVVKDLMKFFVKVAGEQIEVKTFLAADTPIVRGDRGQIEQVLMNLILNARDAMPGGGQLLVETGGVTLEEEYIQEHQYMKKGRHALLVVSDTGIGMDETTREKVFEPFFTTKTPEKGTGLGLSVVYGIVTQHNGYIHVYSEPGKGSAFKVYFPAIEAPADVRVPVKSEPVLGGSETILLAEDEEAIRMLAERILKEIGYTVLTACNGEEAVELFRKHREKIALALLDVVMPRMGGKEAYEAMRKENPGLKTIFMSGYSGNAIHEAIVIKPDTPFLGKPFAPTVLARKVREVLDG